MTSGSVMSAMTRMVPPQSALHGLDASSCDARVLTGDAMNSHNTFDTPDTVNRRCSTAYVLHQVRQLSPCQRDRWLRSPRSRCDCDKLPSCAGWCGIPTRSLPPVETPVIREYSVLIPQFDIAEGRVNLRTGCACVAHAF